MKRTTQEVKTFKLVNGQEVCTESYEYDSLNKVYECKSVMMISIDNSGVPSIMPYVMSAGFPTEQTCEFTKDNVVFVGQTDEDIAVIYLMSLEKSDEMLKETEPRIFVPESKIII